MLRQLKALWVLGWALVAKLLMDPFVRHRGVAPWLARLRQESLAPTPPSTWQHLERASRCIGCGICDAVRLDVRSTSHWIAGSGRAPSDAPLLLAEVPAIVARAPEIARICPTRVGVDDLAALITDHAQILAEREP